MLGYSLGFTMNSVFYLDDAIDRKEDLGETSKSNNFFVNYFVFYSENLTISLWSIIISMILTFLLRLIIYIPIKVREEFNAALVTENKKIIKEAKKKFDSEMKCQIVCWLVAVVVINCTCSYLIICFCSIFNNSDFDWLVGGVISIGMEIILIKNFLCVVKSLIRSLTIWLPNKVTYFIFYITLKIIGIFE